MPVCWKCEPGNYISTLGSIFPEDCVPCATGTYTSDHGAPACTLCPPGSYNDDLGREECKLCPPRTYGPTVGATTVDFCDFCPRWHFNTTPGQGGAG